MRQLYSPSSRFFLTASVLLAGFIIAEARLVDLQILQSEKLQALAEGKHQKTHVKPARRGDIVDRNGDLLAHSKTLYNIGIDPQAVIARDIKAFGKVEALLQIPSGTIGKALQNASKTARWRALAERIEPAVYEKLKALKLKSIYANPSYQRHYPAEHLAGHTLGFVNKDQQATGGIEQICDFYLKGRDGYIETEMDGRRSELPQFRTRVIQGRKGLAVQLNLDIALQHLAEAQIDALAEQYQPKAISILVSDPSDGAILAIANYPRLNPNRYWDYPIDHHRNRALSDIYEPGSTFKIIPMASILNLKLMHAANTIDCGREYASHRGRKLRLPSDYKAFGKLTLKDIIRYSSNRGAAQLALKLGEKELYKAIRSFGFAERSGIELPGESIGQLAPPHKWDSLSITRIPIGHAIAITPLQLHLAMCTIANNGLKLRPRILKAIIQNNTPLLKFPRIPEGQIISPEAAKTLTSMLVAVTGPGGTATQAAIEGYSVAGKTGTTQKIIDGAYSQRHHIASFSGFFPAEKPKLVITIIVDEPQSSGIGYGGRIAAPAFARLAELAAQYLKIPPQRQQ